VNFFSPQTFEQHMRTAWSPAKEVKFRILEDNMFTIQCSCLGDWLKVTKGGPWLFRQNAVTIEEYDGLSDPMEINMNLLAVWVQIHKLPDGYRGDSLVRNLAAKKFDSVIEVDSASHGLGDFIRVRVKLDLRKPIARFVSISREGRREFFKIQFEKIPRFCGACGMVGHSYLECGTGEHDESKLKWGDFLKAERETWYGRFSFGGNRGGPRGARGRNFPGRGMPEQGGRGRGDIPPPGRGFGATSHIAWRHNALAVINDAQVLGSANKGGTDVSSSKESLTKEDEDLKDTGSSPLKNNLMDVDKQNMSTDAGAKRSLELSIEEETTKDIPVEIDGNRTEAARGLSNQGGSQDTGAAETDRNKRSKKDGAISPSLGSAGSLEGPVRSQ
jgi:hypothetical protein